MIPLKDCTPTGTGATALQALVAAAEASITEPNPAEQTILAKLDEALARTQEGRLRVAMLGQFKRGKSTLLNALLGVPLLPTGITPVTAIPTYVHFATSPSLRIEFEGSRSPLESRDPSKFTNILARYVAETANAGNREQVRSVEIAVDSATFSDRVVLVDTPGVGSTFLHNSRTAEAVLSDCDVGIFVLSPDPPITEVELGYLDNVRRVIPKLYFALNKIDLLSPDEQDIALSFLANVLEDKLGPGRATRIFTVSAKAGLSAKQEGDGAALAASGLLELEQALADELTSEERAIAFATGRSRAISLVGELLYHRQLEHKALLTPEQDLVQKIGEFERAISRFESEKADLSDLMGVDRRRLLVEVEAATDRIWTEARSKFAKLAIEETSPGFDEGEARAKLGKALEKHFETAAHEATESTRAELISRLEKHEVQASALLGQVRQAAADLMEISVRLPPPEHAFELGREAFWVAPAPQNSIVDASALAFIHFMPRALREMQLRRQISSDTERAVLRNVANLDWALRQNVEDAFRRFESSLAEQLSEAIQETRRVMQIALEKRIARSSEVGSLVAQTEQSIAALTAALAGLQNAAAGCVGVG
jgi:Dynamin family